MNNSKRTCNCCGKPLSDPVSVNLGIGPVCRVTKKTGEMEEKTSNLWANRSQYSWNITLDGKILYITDDGGLKSVTNDIENVLNDIKEKVPAKDFSNLRIMYKDSMGIWDGVGVSLESDNTIKSVSFFSLNETGFQNAREKLMKHKIN